MTLRKRFLSLLSAISLLMTSTAFLALPASGEEPDAPAPGTGPARLEAEEYGDANLFVKGENADTNKLSGGYGWELWGTKNDQIQSDDEIAEAIDATRTPYVQFFLDAEEAGDYELKVRIRHTAYAAFPNPTVLLLVNDGAPQKLALTTPAGGGADGEALTFTAALAAGRNILRLTGLTADVIAAIGTNKIGSFIIDYLEIPAGVVGVLPNRVSQAAKSAQYIAHGTKSGDNEDIWGLSYTAVGSVTPDSLSVRNLANVPYFSLTLNVPVSGYYNLAPQVRYYAAETVEMGILINGEIPEKKPLLPATSNGGKTAKQAEADYILYLEQGEYTVAYTGLLQPAPENNTPVTNFYHVILRGGVTMAESQRSPDSFAPPVSAAAGPARLEAEDYGDGNLYAADSNADGRYSGNFALTLPYNQGSAIQTPDEMERALDREKTPFAQFLLDAEADGTYEIKVRFRYLPYGLDRNPAIHMMVNDGAPQEVVVTTAPAGSSANVNETVPLSVPLKKGRNILRLTGLSAEFLAYRNENATQNNGNNTFAIDYLDIPAGVTGLPVTTEKLDANAAAKSHFYQNMTPSADGNSDFWGLNYGGVTDETAETLRMRDLSALPYFAMTFDAPVDGYYNISPTLRYSATQILTMGVLVDSVNPAKKPGLPSTDGAGKGDASHGVEADYIVYLTQGQHVITFTGLLSPKQETGGTVSNFFYVMLRGGVKLAEQQIDPFDAGFTRIEAENSLTNMMKRGTSSWGSYSGGAANSDPVMGVAQTLDEIRKNGLDNTRMAYTLYTVYAPADGEYPVNVRVRYGVYGANKAQYYDKTAHVVVLANEDVAGMGVVDIPILSTRENAMIWDSVTLKLKQGENKIRVTGFTADLTEADGKAFLWNEVEEAFFWLDQDYLAVPSVVTPSAPMGGRVEAEDSLFSYYTHDLYNSSGGFVGLRDENNTQNSITYDITYDSLNGDNMSYIHFVHYKVIAPADGTYDVAIALRATDSYGDNTLNLKYFVGHVAVMVNTVDKYKLEFTLGYRTIYTRLRLKAGLNTISVSGNVREMLDYSVDPVHVSLRIDQDFLDLGPGLVPYNEGYSNSGEDDVATPLLKGIPSGGYSGSVDSNGGSGGLGDFDDGDFPSTDDVGLPAGGEANPLPWCLGLAGASGAAAVFSKRKQSKEQEKS